MSLASLVWISFTRNWLRTCFVLLAVIAAFGLFGALETIRFQRDAPPADADVVIVSPDGPGALPLTYENDILALETVRAGTGLSGVGVQNPESASQPMFIAGVNSANLADTLPGMHISRELMAQWLDTRNGAICDARTVRERPPQQRAALPAGSTRADPGGTFCALTDAVLVYKSSPHVMWNRGSQGPAFDVPCRLKGQ